MRHHHNLVAVFTMAVIAGSCSVEHQVLADGQEVEWAKKQTTPLDLNVAPKQEESVTADASVNVLLDDSPILLTEADSKGFISGQIAAPLESERTGRTDVNGQYLRANQASSELAGLSSEHQHRPQASPPEVDATEGNKGLVTGGWVLAAVGFLLLLFVSILIGALLMLGGIIMIVAGSPQKQSTKPKTKATENTGEWQDVVYLNNGSVIRGMVIEQVPNVSLKIQTADGSVFVYDMKDVQKITKEQKAK